MEVVSITVISGLYLAIVGIMCFLLQWFCPQRSEEHRRLTQALIEKPQKTKKLEDASRVDPQVDPQTDPTNKPRKIRFHEPLVTTIVEIDVETGKVLTVAI